MKRLRSDGKDNKLFAAAKKKVKEDKKAKNEEARQRQTAAGKQRMNLMPKASYGKFGKDFYLYLVVTEMPVLLCEIRHAATLLHPCYD